MTKVGFNLLAWSAKVSEELFPITERLKEIGYDGVEIFIGVSDMEAYKQFGKHAKSLDMEITSVIGLGPDENPISPDAAVRKKAVERIKWFVDCAEAIDSPIVGGPLHSAFATFSDNAPTEDEYKRSAEVLSEAAEYAAKADVMLSVEAINRFECYLCNTVAQMADIVNRVSHPNVTAHYDTHHANIEEKDIIQSIHDVAPVVGHIHISENDRGTPGDGHIPWDGVFNAISEIQYEGWLTIEAFTRNDVDFANSINVWREYSKPWDVAEKGFDLIQKMKKKYNL
jgi:D-psicose/D-tagatose/L-ribulose 3-epimerase